VELGAKMENISYLNLGAWSMEFFGKVPNIEIDLGGL